MGDYVKTAVIFGGAPCAPEKQPPLPPEASLFVCADAGLRLAESMGVRPDWIVGDFDSLGEVPRQQAMAAYPAEKDETDMLLAVQYGLEQGAERFVIYGGLGGRLDHFAANLQTLSYLAVRGAQGILVDENHWITLQRGENRVVYPRRDGMYFSLFAMQGDCVGVTLEGVKYPLENGTLRMDFPLGVSNEIVEEQAVVTVQKGTLLVIYARDGSQK